MLNTDLLIAAVVRMLCDAGLSVCAEFERNALPLPDEACFVTVGAEQIRMQAAIPQGTACVIPVSFALRIRIHTKTGTPAALSGDAVRKILAALLPGRNPFPAAADASAAVYQKQLDCLTTELHMQLDGLLTVQEGDDTLADDAEHGLSCTAADAR